MTVQKIVDISVAQPLGSVDFAKAMLDGVVGCIVRAEYGKTIDAYFHRHIEAAMAAGMRVGCYAFQMTDADPADEVAALANELRASGYVLDYGVSLDVETLNHQ
ncbi:MAG TPA: GH25 family lysozyme, partial [Polyangiaceae bacterium]|nr:GH25 family lysozyme [Polyangiaceae bacterium]